MTLNTCASMKLEVHFQRKQVSPGPEGNVHSWGGSEPAVRNNSRVCQDCPWAAAEHCSSLPALLGDAGLGQRGVCGAVPCHTMSWVRPRCGTSPPLAPSPPSPARCRRPPAAGQNGRKAAARGIVPVSGSPSPQHKEAEGEGAGVCEAGAGRSCCSSSEAMGFGVGVLGVVAAGCVAAGCVAARFGLRWLTRAECFCWVRGHRATRWGTPAACHAAINTEPGPGSCSGEYRNSTFPSPRGS